MTDRNGSPDEALLHGGVANAGAVTRQGNHVLRPANPHSPSIHAFLRALAETGFDGASQPIGIDADGRERLVFIEGDVPIPPYPAWAQTDDALASVAVLLRRYHDAAGAIEARVGPEWSDEMADPLTEGRDAAHATLVMCHNDVCLENVVFRDGVAVGLLDFDFAAPGRALYDLAQFARMCVPVDDPMNSRMLGWDANDVGDRLRVIADAYGLPPDRSGFLDVLAGGIERGGQFVHRKVAAGDPNFIKMWNDLGGMERFDRRRRWFNANRSRIAEALG